MNETAGTVFIIDSDEGVRRIVANLVRSIGLKAEAFDSPADFLQTARVPVPSCIIMDVRFVTPERSGLDFQNELLASKTNFPYPVVFLTSFGDVRMSVQAMKLGAIDFLTKPGRDQELLDAVSTGIEQSRHQIHYERSTVALIARFSLLTHRERGIFALVTTGLLNKQIAAQLGISEVTVKVHRGHVMKKMEAKSLVDLVRISDKLASSRLNKPSSDGTTSLRLNRIALG